VPDPNYQTTPEQLHDALEEESGVTEEQRAEKTAELQGQVSALEREACAVLAKVALKERDEANGRALRYKSERDQLREQMREYLDEAITSWRAIRNDENHEHKDLAPYYVDAFQSVRVSMLGTMLPKEGTPDG
jgi:hypothetical protein